MAILRHLHARNASINSNERTQVNVSTFKSWEFVLLVLTNAAIWLSTAGSTIHSKDAYLFTAASAGAYALARGLAKINTDGRPIYQTTEFYVVIFGAAATVIGGLNGHLSATAITLAIAALTAASAIANGLRTPPPAT